MTNPTTPELLSESEERVKRDYEVIARQALARHPLKLLSVIGGGPFAWLVRIFTETLQAELRTADELHVVTVEARIYADKENTALRNQLAQADETNRLAGLQIVELESRLAQVEKELSDTQQKLMRRCSHPNTYPLKEATRRCHDCGVEILL